MIFANRHHLFPSIARASSWLSHIDAKIWWARHAIASYRAVGFHEETDPETIAQHLNAPVDHPVADTELWTSHYLPQITSSISAVEMALRRRLPIHIAEWDKNVFTEEEVIDWLNMLAAESHPLFGKLSRITWRQAVGHACRWRDLAERQNAKIAGPEGATEILRLGKLTWYRLDTVEAIHCEGQAMRNCLASGDYDHVPGLSYREVYDGLYSLRDAKGRSRITVLLWRGKITQAYEYANRPMSPESRPSLEALEAHVQQGQGRPESAQLDQ